MEEGGFESGVFKAIRIWNGDETDWGLNFASGAQIVRVILGTYRGGPDSRSSEQERDDRPGPQVSNLLRP